MKCAVLINCCLQVISVHLYKFSADWIFLVHIGSNLLLTGMSRINSAGTLADTCRF